MAPKVCFLETSALIDLCFRKGQHEALSRETATPAVRVTNNYVRMEIKRGVLQYLVYLHSVLVNSTKYSEVYRVINRVHQQRYRQGTVAETLEALWEEIGKESTGALSLDSYVLKKVKDFLVLHAYRLWNAVTSTLVDGASPNLMACYEDIKGLTVNDKTGSLENVAGSRCTSSKLECNLKGFLRERKPELEKVLEKLDSLHERDPEQAKSRTHLKEALKKCESWKHALSNKEGYQTCWSCGDIIITISAPEDATICTSNTKHFAPLCEATGRHLFPSHSED
ncbi:MAG: hypothetical protein AMXMBFR33_65500 [Candidatus Xenobia bacterium]